ncbi:fatty acid hydroxylase domain-containing protein 2-like [Uranotaenia lowii]|uniref:fatty acid hydroxylase domain-containing protein 2-like n=1 Tax=Uranotaenia lowii TaxID=190385 RepID=UPI002479790F|nr:fatty acid hydroxylase domain-containing protein 2-like [Uranotaenia lowii]
MEVCLENFTAADFQPPIEGRYFIQDCWIALLDVIGDDPEFLYVWALPLWTNAFYWMFGSLFLIVDLTGKPSFLRKYKTQPGKNEPLDKAEMVRVFLWILFNQFVVQLPIAYIGYQLADKTNAPNMRILPSGWVVLRDICIGTFFVEVGVYYVHRCMHKKPFYRLFHRMHHEETAPYALYSLYCHPLEHLLNNIIPSSLGIILMKSHPATAAIHYPLMLIETMRDHCGYHLPFFFSPERHDYHHAKYTDCYGPFGIMDWLHGTEGSFRKTKQFQRDRILLTTRSAREIFPDH